MIPTTRFLLFLNWIQAFARKEKRPKIQSPLMR
jgi:hypothetical protein